MATYAAYRHIELDKVGYSKKRVRNPPSDIFNVMCTPPTNKSMNGSSTPRRSNSHNNSFDRLFGSPDVPAPRRSSLTKGDATNRNPVTGNGVISWDCKVGNRNAPKIHTERNPVTGEYYTIVSPATTPTKPIANGIPQFNGTSTPVSNGHHEVVVANGNTTNGQA